MEFIVTRTSEYDLKPCTIAFKSRKEYWHTRTCTEEEFNKRFSECEGLWRSKGKNHTITKDGYITRQEESMECWKVKISSLKELKKFVNQYGTIIIGIDSHNEKLYTIEIYDDYRE
jgi:hypothetical protein